MELYYFNPSLLTPRHKIALPPARQVPQLFRPGSDSSYGRLGDARNMSFAPTRDGSCNGL